MLQRHLRTLTLLVSVESVELEGSHMTSAAFSSVGEVQAWLLF